MGSGLSRKRCLVNSLLTVKNKSGHIVGRLDGQYSYLMFIEATAFAVSSE